MKTLFTLCCFMFMVATTAHATKYYVSKTGTPSNSNSCATATNPATAKATITGTTGGWECAQTPGDVVEIGPGTYVEAVRTLGLTIASGTAQNPMTLQAAAVNTVFIQPSSGCTVMGFETASAVGYWTVKNVTLDGRNLNCGTQTSGGVGIGSANPSIVLEDVTIRDISNNSNSPPGQGNSLGLSSGSHDTRITRVTFDGTHKVYGDYKGSHCIYAGQRGNGSNRTIIEYSQFLNCGGAGIQMNDSGSPTGPAIDAIIRYNYIYKSSRRGPADSGIIITQNESNTSVYGNVLADGAYGAALGSYGYQNANNVFYNNTVVRYPTCIDFGAFTNGTNTIAKNNICESTPTGIIVRSNSTGAIIQNNIVHNSAAPYTNTGVGTLMANLLTGDPQFVDLVGSDFHLQAISPARNTGISTGVTNSIDFVIRPQGGVIDIGAYEYVETTSSGPLTVFVSPIGNDSQSCTTADINQPRRTIAGGIACLTTAGSTLFIRAGTYVENIDTSTQSIAGGTSWTTPTLIAAYASEVVTLQLPSSKQVSIFMRNVTNDHYIIFDRLILDAMSNASSNGLVYYPGTHHIRFQNGEIKNTVFESVYISDAASTEVLNSVLHDSPTFYAIRGRGAVSGTILRGNIIYNAGNSGVRLDSNDVGTAISNVMIERNTILNVGVANSLPAMQVGGTGNTNLMVRNNLIYGSYRGIEVVTGTPSAKIMNNTVYGSLSTGIQINAGAVTTQVKNNISFGNTGTAIADASGQMVGVTNQTTDPLFTNVATGDFSLLPTSTAIDTGTNIAPDVIDDLESVVRPQNAGYDIGALEFVGTPGVGGDSVGPRRVGSSKGSLGFFMSR